MILHDMYKISLTCFLTYLCICSEPLLSVTFWTKCMVGTSKRLIFLALPCMCLTSQQHWDISCSSSSRVGTDVNVFLVNLGHTNRWKSVGYYTSREFIKLEQKTYYMKAFVVKSNQENWFMWQFICIGINLLPHKLAILHSCFIYIYMYMF